MEDYIDRGEEVAKILQDYYKDKDGWTLSKKTKDGASISYRHSKEFDGYLYKGECMFDAPPATVFRYVDPLPDSAREKWDSNMKKIETLEWLQKDKLRINRACTASAMMGLISPRDFVDLILNKETDSYLSTNAVSIRYSKCAEEKKYVRGWNYPCGLICEKVEGEPNKTKLVSLIQPDIGGMLPRTMVDSAIPSSMTSFFSELKEALKKDGISS
ncbi:stAR-related lipid transfer protein 5-like isoform X1 [Mya arenaria]|uniref:stAR-related lipid transfer protein 5-like isoform X1 n=1 Tax=Mya arenaria TaxID=6604 RepID=UPI0022E1E9B0|nr:stAR-related lipid transfer protein 5-like isoform X1 [Mya arenaria]